MNSVTKTLRKSTSTTKKNQTPEAIGESSEEHLTFSATEIVAGGQPWGFEQACHFDLYWAIASSHSQVEPIWDLRLGPLAKAVGGEIRKPTRRIHECTTMFDRLEEEALEEMEKRVLPLDRPAADTHFRDLLTFARM